jgi:hypothetical protein
MWMKIEPATERVRYNQDQRQYGVVSMHPAFDDGSAESCNIAKEFSIAL